MTNTTQQTPINSLLAIDPEARMSYSSLSRGGGVQECSVKTTGCWPDVPGLNSSSASYYSCDLELLNAKVSSFAKRLNEIIYTQYT